MNDLSAEGGPQQLPIIKTAIDTLLTPPGLNEEERKMFQFEYVIEDLETYSPYFTNYNPNNKLLIGILNGSSIIYTTEAAHHRAIREAEGVDTEFNKSHFQIDYMPSGLDISLNGTREQVLQIARFLIKSGFTPESSVKSSIWEDGKWNNGGKGQTIGTLGNLNI